MKKIKCIIADDEILSLEVLENYISKLETYQIVGKYKNGVEVFNALKSSTVDLLFLDIQMPQLTGLELLKSLKNVPPTIFTTAFREHALEGYEMNAIDYLLKPISFDRFLRAIEKFEITTFQIDTKRHRGQDLPPVTSVFIYVKSAKKTIKIFLKDILYIEGAKEVTKITTANGEVSTYQSLQEFEQQLPDDSFIRIHRSYIIAIDRIQAYDATHVEVGEAQLPIGHSYLRLVREALKL